MVPLLPRLRPLVLPPVHGHRRAVTSRPPLDVGCGCHCRAPPEMSASAAAATALPVVHNQPGTQAYACTPHFAGRSRSPANHADIRSQCRPAAHVLTTVRGKVWVQA